MLKNLFSGMSEQFWQRGNVVVHFSALIAVIFGSRYECMPLIGLAIGISTLWCVLNIFRLNTEDARVRNGQP